MTRYHLTEMKLIYTERVNKMICGHRRGAWMDSELVRPRTELLMLKSFVEFSFAAHCPSGCLR